MRLFHNQLLTQPHVDRFNVERVLAYADGALSEDDGNRADILSEGWQDAESMPPRGDLNPVLVVRPAFLADGPEKGDAREGGAYWIAGDEKGSDGFAISKKDATHFIVDREIAEWSSGRASG
ncbi:hypothetical protein PsYK624_153450 [Phanerochaete sordida]|uniref:Uncharacterized protein n=1 Tax=Phanerochaete sordida TaxID=48140 RepID=A0A9P3LLV8_9APHY|nr:hypothetical protein PsYK624_153450 [Phanerochaete sordida]